VVRKRAEPDHPNHRTVPFNDDRSTVLLLTSPANSTSSWEQGEYQLRDGERALGRVTITGGQVTEAAWPGSG
jgi:hypothetical protein